MPSKSLQTPSGCGGRHKRVAYPDARYLLPKMSWRTTLAALLLWPICNTVTSQTPPYGTHLVPVTWQDAVTWCDNLGGSLAAPVDDTQESAISQASNIQSEMERYWTPLFINGTGSLQWEGTAYHVIDDATRLPWKTQKTSLTPGVCVAMEITKLQTVVDVASCNMTFRAICRTTPVTSRFKSCCDGGDYNDTEVTNGPTSHHSNVANDGACALRCLATTGCVRYVYSLTLQRCDLYHHWSDTTDLSPADAVHKKFANCQALQAPKHGRVATSAPGSLVGAAVTYSCSSPWKTPAGTSTEEVTCGRDGRWSALPSCKVPDLADCPDGWTISEGTCYWISSEAKTWREADVDCKVKDAVLLRLSAGDRVTMDNFLYFRAQTSYWTGGTDQEVEGEYRWSGQYNTWQKFTLHWHSGRPLGAGKDCLVITKNISGVVTSRPLFADVNCQTQLPYICQKGRRYLGQSCKADDWCTRKAVCFGFCSCQGTFNHGVGTRKTPSASCTLSTMTHANGLETALFSDSTMWALAKEACTLEGGSLVAPVSEQWQSRLMLHKPSLLEGVRMWTGLTVNGSQVRDMGVAEFDVLDKSALPWRTGMTPLSEEGDCVTMEITGLGVRLHREPCTATNYFICQMFSVSTRAASLGSQLVSGQAMAAMAVDTLGQCSMECFLRPACDRFGLLQDGHHCLLYSASPASSLPQNLQLWKKTGTCAPLTTGEGVTLTATASTSAGATVTFACSALYELPGNSTGSVTCTNGRWSYFPYCNYQRPCPEGWAREGTSCYLIHLQGAPFWNASKSCKEDNAYSLEVDGDQSEMDFLINLLSFNSSLAVWTGGSDQGARGWYRWLRDFYTQVTYTDWYPGRWNGSLFVDAQPEHKVTIVDASGKTETKSEWCVELRAIYKSVPWGRHYFSDNICDTVQPFVCETKVVNVGSTGCTRFGMDSCKDLAQCVSDVCTCPPETTRQTGVDGLHNTTCDKIRPVSEKGCKMRDDLCWENSFCNTTDSCQCPQNTFQNGQDFSFVTTCDNQPVGCPSQWRGFGKECYKMFRKGLILSGALAADQECTVYGASLAYPRSQEENDFLLEMGMRANIWIGIHGRLNKLTTRDGEDIGNFTNWYRQDFLDGFELNETCAFMLVVGKWEVENCLKSAISIPKLVCVKPKGCWTPPAVVNAESTSHLRDMEVGSRYTYKCQAGYVLAGNHDGTITCLQDSNGTAFWSDPPSCSAVVDEVFGAMTTSDLHGAALWTGTAGAVGACAWKCYGRRDCLSLAFTPSPPTCRLFGPGSSVSPDPSADRRKRIHCPPVPRVEGAEMEAAGRQLGSTVRYTCNQTTYIAKNESSVITCLPDGQWQTPPTCRRRFARLRMWFIKVYENKDAAFSVPTLDACERLCVAWTDFRCLAVRYEAGSCYLQSSPYTDHMAVGIVTSHIYFWYSQLTESSLEEFTPMHAVPVTATPIHVMGNASAEQCAQSCLGNETCETFTVDSAQTCHLYNVIPDVSTTDVNRPTLYRRTRGCPTPPAVTHGSWTAVLRQKEASWSVGDKLQFRCSTLGTDILAGHSGLVTCLKTGHWSRPPVCSHLCQADWYFRNGTCYRLVETGTAFWKAHDACLALDASLLHLQNQDDVDFPEEIRRRSNLSQTSYWLGLFADRSVWRWIDRHRGNVSRLNVTLPSLTSDAAVVLDVTSTGSPQFLAQPTSATTIGYVCTKATPKLQCRAGWHRHNGSCYLMSTTKLNFDGAQTACQALNANLAPFRSRADDDMLHWMLNASNLGTAETVYLGLRRDAHRDYVSNDGSALTYVMYHAASAPASVSQCLYLSFNNRNFTGSCSLHRHYICSGPLEVVGEPTDYRGVPCATDGFCGSPELRCIGGFHDGRFYPPTCRHTDCPVPWQYQHGRCVMVTEKKQTYISTTSLCAHHGGKVMTVTSMHDNYFLVELSERYFGSAIPLWVGMDRLTASSWIPVSPTRGFTLWRESYSTHYRCVAISIDPLTTGYWSTRPCNYTYHGVCEKQLSSSVSEFSPFYEGCFKKISQYDLARMTWTTATLTIDKCRTYCGELGFKFAALMATTCDCGHTVQQARRYNESACVTPCPGNSSTVCGLRGVYYSVYRTSDVQCGGRLLGGREDPQSCFTAGTKMFTWSQARCECARQGGDLATVHTPQGQLDLYHGALGEISSSLLSAKVYLGMIFERRLIGSLQHYNFWGVDNEARHFSFFTGDIRAAQAGKTCVVGFTFLGGAWRTEECEPSPPSSAYICQFRANASVVTDNEQRTLMFRETRTDVSASLPVVTSSSLYRYRNHLRLDLSFRQAGHPVRLTSAMFGQGCLNDRSRCPEGFTLTAWIRVNASGSSDVDILASGDCASSVLPGRGFCLLYSGATGQLIVVDVQEGVRRLGQASLSAGAWHHVTVVAANQTVMALYVDGVNASTVTDVPPRVEAPTVTFDQVLLGNWHSSLQQSDVSVSHVSLTPRVLRWHELQEIYERGAAPSGDPVGLWGLGEASSLAPQGAQSVLGVAGRGRRLDHRGAVVHLTGQAVSSTCAGDLGRCSRPASLSFWLKVDRFPSSSFDVLRSGGVENQNTGLRMHVSREGQLMAELRTSGGTLETQTAFPIGQWTSVAVVMETAPSLSLYVGGVLAGSSTTVISSGGHAPSDLPTLDLGRGICPLGWKQISASCYKLETTERLFWQHVAAAMGVGAHLQFVDSAEELQISKATLANSGKKWMLGTYQESSVTWANALGSPPDLDLGVSPGSNSSLSLNCLASCSVEKTDYSAKGPAVYEIDLDDHAFPQRDRCGQSSLTWLAFQDSCYYVENTARTLSAHTTQCNAKGSRVVEINTLEELNFISQLILRGTVRSTTYILVGLTQEQLGDGSVGFVYSDWTSPPFHRWLPNQSASTSNKCTRLSCVNRECLLQSASCTSSARTLCERPAESRCAVGWKQYGNRCLQALTGLSDVNITVCQKSGATGLTFSSLTELQDIASHLGLLTTTNYLTDAVRQGGKDVWRSSGTPVKASLVPPGTSTYLSVRGNTLTRTNGPFSSVVCQYEHELSVTVDEVEFHDKALSSSEVTSLHQALVPPAPKQLLCHMDGVTSSGVDCLVINVATSTNVTARMAGAGVAKADHSYFPGVSRISGALRLPMSALTPGDRLCLVDVTQCRAGFTVAFWLYVTKGSNVTLFAGTGQPEAGVAISYRNWQLSATVREPNFQWTARTWLPAEDWNHVTVTWDSVNGLAVYVNAVPVTQTGTAARRYPYRLTPEADTGLEVGNFLQGGPLYMAKLTVTETVWSVYNIREHYESKHQWYRQTFDHRYHPEESNLELSPPVELSSLVWRNSFFKYALSVSNPTGVASKVFKSQKILLKCAVQVELCSGPLTVSLWLNPLDFERDQLILRAVTVGQQAVTVVSWYLSYEASSDHFWFAYHVGRRGVKRAFKLDFLRWWHLVAYLDPTNYTLQVFVNGNEVTLFGFAEWLNTDNPPTLRVPSHLELGVSGTFLVDDVRVETGRHEPESFYLLRSCHEYRLAGFDFSGRRMLQVDPDDDGPLPSQRILCDFNLDASLGISVLDYNASLSGNLTDQETFDVAAISFTMPSDVISHVMNESQFCRHRSYWQGGDGEVCCASIGYEGLRLKTGNASLPYPVGVTLVPDISSNPQPDVPESEGALVLSGEGVALHGLREPCLTHLPACKFGYSFSLRIYVINVTSAGLVVHEAGGDVTSNEVGVRLLCSLSSAVTFRLDCTAVVANSTGRWSLGFSLLRERWTHLSLAWNPQLGLKVFVNGHTVEELGINATYSAVAAVSPSRPAATLGMSLHTPGMTGHLLMQDVRINDRDVAEHEIRQMFGTVNTCVEGWVYNEGTGLCYNVTTTSTTHSVARRTCRDLGGSLAVVSDDVTFNWVRTNVIQAAQVTSSVHVGMTQTKPGGVLRWLDGTLVTSQVTITRSTTRKLTGQLHPSTRSLRATWTNPSERAVCQRMPYALPRKELYLATETPTYNYTSLANSSHVSFTPGLRGKMVDMPQPPAPSRVLLGECLGDSRLCHNGWSLLAWLFPKPLNLSLGSTETLITTVGDGGVGLTVFGEVASTSSPISGFYQLTFEMNNCTSALKTSFAVTTEAWYHLYVSVSNASEPSVLLNGLHVSSLTWIAIASHLACPAQSSVGTLVVGASQHGQDVLSASVDDLQVFEHQLLNASQVRSAAREAMPRRWELPFEDPSTLLRPTAANLQTGRFGYAPYFDGSADKQVAFAGQFAYDCLGSPDFCDDGFTLTLWVRIAVAAADCNYGIFSMANRGRGLLLACLPASGHQPSGHRLQVRTHTRQHDLTLAIPANVWSHLLLTWRPTGYLMQVNGLPQTRVAVKTLNVSPYPVVKLHFGHVDDGVQTIDGFTGAVDNFVFNKESVTNERAFQMYWKSVYVEIPIHLSMENQSGLPSNSEKPEVVPGLVGEGMAFLSPSHRSDVTAALSTQPCFLGASPCPHGFTLSLMLRFLGDSERDQTLLHTDGCLGNGLGVCIRHTAKNVSMPFRRYFRVTVLTPTRQHKVWLNLAPAQWAHLLVSWSQVFGLTAYVDGKSADSDITGSARSLAYSRHSNLTAVLGQGVRATEEHPNFHLDELTMWDKAVKSGKEPVQDWQHAVHHVPGSTPVSTRWGTHLEDCRDLCSGQASCQAFAFCPGDQEGTCYLHDERVPSLASLSPNTSCDAFFRIQLRTSYLHEGCYGLNDVTSGDNVTSVRHAEECRELCGARGLRLAAVFNGSSCVCKDALALSAPVDGSLCSESCPHLNNETCGGPQALSVYRTSTLVGFVSPVQDVYAFNVSFFPGTVVLVNETVNVTIGVVPESFAGFHVTCTALGLSFFTGLPYFSLEFAQSGRFELTIRAMNEISHKDKVFTFRVYHPVKGVAIAPMDPVVTRTAAAISINVSSAGNLTCRVQYGDGGVATVPWSSHGEVPQIVLSHTFAAPGVYTVEASCSNNATVFSDSIPVVVQNAATGLNLIVKSPIEHGKDITGLLSVQAGTNVSITVLLDGEVVEALWSGDGIFRSNLTIPESSYNTTGIHEVAVRARNLVTSAFVNSTVHVAVPVDFALLSTNATHHAVGNAVEIRFEIDKGSSMKLNWTTGDGRTHEVDVQRHVVNETIVVIYGGYANPGLYTISAEASNIFGSVTKKTSIYVEYPVDDVSIDMADIPNPDFTFFVNISVGSAQVSPTNAKVDISYGDAGNVTYANILTTSLAQSFSHTYGDHGEYPVAVTVSNNVSTKTVSRLIKVGGPVSNLTVAVSQIHIPLGSAIILSVDVGFGSLMKYSVDFGDATNATSPGNLSFPTAAFALNHVFAAEGGYVITVCAENSFNVLCDPGVEVTVQKTITGLDVVTSDPIRIGRAMTFTAVTSDPGTDSCYLWNFGDGSFLVVGSSNCANASQYQGIPFEPLTKWPLRIGHTYVAEREYIAHVNASNLVSQLHVSTSVMVYEYICIEPRVDVLGFPKIANDSIAIPRASRFQVTANIDSQCDPPVEAIYTWALHTVNSSTGESESVSTPKSGTPLLVVPGRFLGLGLHRVSLTVSYAKGSLLSTTDSAFVTIVPSDLVLLFDGDDFRTWSMANDLHVKVSRSHDPDGVDPDEPLTFAWACHVHGSPISKGAIDPLDPAIFDLSGAPCFPNSTGQVSLTKDELSVAASLLVKHRTYVFTVEARKDSRRTRRQHYVKIIPEGTVQLQMRCEDNCAGKVSPTRALRYQSVCTSCTESEARARSYLWQLYKEDPEIARMEVTQLANWTTTGVNSHSLMVTAGLLHPGNVYMLRLTSDTSVTEKKLHVSYPPYGGVCRTNNNLGVAFTTKFVVICEGWLDEGARPLPDASVDVLFREPLNFRFIYQVRGSGGQPVALAAILGSEVSTPEFALQSGLVDHNNLVDILVNITDSEGTTGHAQLSVQVLSDPESGGVPGVYDSLQYKEFQAEKDITALLILNVGIMDTANAADLQTHGALIMEQVRSLAGDIETPVQVELLTQLLEMLVDTDDLPQTVLNDIIEVYSTLLQALPGIMEGNTDSHLQQTIGKDILRGLSKLVVGSRFDSASCQTECSGQSDYADRVLEVFSGRGVLVGLMLDTTVPGEEATELALEYEDFFYQVFRYDSSLPSPQTLSLGGRQVARLPDLSQHLSEDILAGLQVEVIESGRLQSTTATARASMQRTTSVTFYDKGTLLSLTELSPPLSMFLYSVSPSSSPPSLLNASLVDLTSNSSTDMFFIKVSRQPSGTAILVDVDLVEENVTLNYYVRAGRQPSNTSYDVTGSLPSNDSQALFPWRLTFVIESESENDIFFGFVPVFGSGNTSGEAYISVSAAACFYWNPDKNSWAQDGLSHGREMDEEKVECLSNHTTTFGANFFVPPNTINFSTVFSKPINDNVAVITTVVTVFVLYLVCLFFARREDLKDIQRWSVEPLSDNVVEDVYHYQVTVYTGLRRAAGTKSNVFFVLGGEYEETEIRAMKDDKGRELSRGSVRSYILSVPRCLGQLQFLRLWHDDSGKGPDGAWYVSLVQVRDLQTKDRYVFLADRWLALDRGEGDIECMVSVATQEELRAFAHKFLFQSRRDLTDSHLWFSVLSRPTRSTFTRVQRLSCCLSLLYATMIANAMWYRDTEAKVNSGDQLIHIGDFTFSAFELSSSVLSSLVVIPVSLAIVTFFRKCKLRPKKKSETNSLPPPDRETPEYYRTASVNSLALKVADLNYSQGLETPEAPIIEDVFAKGDNPSRKEGKKKRRWYQESRPLPHWCVWGGWFLVAVSVGLSAFFTVLYSLEWGTQKSQRWLTAFILSFFQSVVVVQPLKVLVVALCLSLIFRKAGKDDEEDEEEEEGLGQTPMSYMQAIGTACRDSKSPMGPAQPMKPVHRRPFEGSPLDTSKMEDSREYRRKQNKLIKVCWEVGVYVFYLIIVSILCYENRDNDSYREIENIRNIFIEPMPHLKGAVIDRGLSQIASFDNFWEWSEGRLLRGLYAGDWYNGDSMAPIDASLLADRIHYRVGPPRIRQARVKRDKCHVVPVFRSFIDGCLAGYSARTYDSRDCLAGWNCQDATGSADPWLYHSALELEGMPLYGRTAIYSGGGYTASLGNSLQEATAMIRYLKSQSWLDRATRMVTVEMNVYNPHVNLFCSVSLVLEILPTGSVMPFPRVASLRLYRYVGPAALIMVLVDLVFVAFTTYYLVDVVKRVCGERCRFLASFWNVVDLANVCSAIVSCAFYGVHFLITKFTLNNFRGADKTFVNFERIAMWDEVFAFTQAFLLFFSMIKLLRLIRFNTKVAQMAGTLRKAVTGLVSFLIVFMVFFVAFTLCGHLVFGNVHAEYSTFSATVGTLFSMLLMKVNSDPLVGHDRTLGAFFLFSFIFVVVFVLINMLLSIINEAFTDARQDKSCRPDDPEVVDFFLKEFLTFVGFDDNLKRREKKPAEKKSILATPSARTAPSLWGSSPSSTTSTLSFLSPSPSPAPGSVGVDSRHLQPSPALTFLSLLRENVLTPFRDDMASERDVTNGFDDEDSVEASEMERAVKKLSE